MLKRILLTGFILLMFGEVAHSQVWFGGRLSGVRSNIKDIHASEPRYGIQAGAFAMIPVSQYNDVLYYNPEINYSMQGEHNSIHSQGVKQKIFLDYINVVLQMKFYFDDTESAFFATAGPYVGYLINKQIDKYDFETAADTYEFNDFDFGGVLGVGYSFNRTIEVDFRFYFGFADTVKNDILLVPNRNGFYNLGVSYIFE